MPPLVPEVFFRVDPCFFYNGSSLHVRCGIRWPEIPQLSIFGKKDYFRTHFLCWPFGIDPGAEEHLGIFNHRLFGLSSDRQDRYEAAQTNG
jgi:hypothetical protein